MPSLQAGLQCGDYSFSVEPLCPLCLCGWFPWRILKVHREVQTTLGQFYVCCRTDMVTSNLYVPTNMKVVDSREVKRPWLILVVEDVYETRAGIDTLLKANGYRVAFAGTEGEAPNSTRPERPDLILVSAAGLPNNVLAEVARIRSEAALGDEVPVVVFCAQDISEGEEVAIGENVYLTNPDNFNQLRSLVARLLPESSHGDVTN